MQAHPAAQHNRAGLTGARRVWKGKLGNSISTAMANVLCASSNASRDAGDDMVGMNVAELMLSDERDGVHLRQHPPGFPGVLGLRPHNCEAHGWASPVWRDTRPRVSTATCGSGCFMSKIPV